MRPGAESLDSEMVTLPSGTALVQWRRNARARRVSLRIDPSDGAIVVTLPPRASRKAGMALLMGHMDWVAQRLAALPAPVTLADGTEVPIGGVPHRIRHHPDRRGGAWLEAGELHVTGAPEFLARRVVDFLRAEAGRRLLVLVRAKAGMAGVIPARVTIKDTTSRWGSCATDGGLAFSWRLVMAPVFVQDYVAAHEVAHLRHMNHSPDFWALVAGLTAHSSRAMIWLRREGPRLLRVG
ncbi:MAG: M48 family peptidase [Acetobacteraceae bacterium]|nr:M48 family peptidase [Acetobacteraceae bacterium]